MGFVDQIGGVLQQYANGAPAGATREQAQGHYDQIASAVPLNVLASVIGPALASLGTPQIRERIQNSASEMSSQQRSDFMQTLLNGLKSSGIDLESSRRQPRKRALNSTSRARCARKTKESDLERHQDRAGLEQRH